MKKLSMFLTVTMLVISAGTAFIAFGDSFLGNAVRDVTGAAATVVEGTGDAAGTVLRGTGDVLTGNVDGYDEAYEDGPEEDEDEE